MVTPRVEVGPGEAYYYDARAGEWKRSIFYKQPKHPELAEIVTFESVEEAEEAAKKLIQLFNDSLRRGDRDYAVVVKRATVLAANRAKAFLKRKNLHPETRERMRRIYEIYRAAYQKMELPRARLVAPAVAVRRRKKKLVGFV